MSAPTRVPLSVLDLAPISEGSDAATALHDTVDLARHAEQWGYSRYWLAEHHFVDVASSSPVVLAGQIAGATSTIRVGSAAVQTGHRTAVSIVEEWATLDAFHPGRFDLGLGRSGQRRAEIEKAVTASAAAAEAGAPTREREVINGVVIPAPLDLGKLLTSGLATRSFDAVTPRGAIPPDFAEQVDDIEAFLRGSYTTPDGVELRTTPGAGADLQVWIFGSSRGQSAQVAGSRGLPFVANYHVSPSTTLEAVEAYRDAFVPSEAYPEPYVVVSADVVVADDDDTAAGLASTYPHWVHSIRSGRGAVQYPDPATAEPLTPEQLTLVRDRVETQFVGGPGTVVARLEALQALTGADELVITSVTHRHDDRLRSHELLATEWGLS